MDAADGLPSSSTSSDRLRGGHRDTRSTRRAISGSIPIVGIGVVTVGVSVTGILVTGEAEGASVGALVATMVGIGVGGERGTGVMIGWVVATIGVAVGELNGVSGPLAGGDVGTLCGKVGEIVGDTFVGTALESDVSDTGSLVDESESLKTKKYSGRAMAADMSRIRVPSTKQRRIPVLLLLTAAVSSNNDEEDETESCWFSMSPADLDILLDPLSIDILSAE